MRDHVLNCIARHDGGTVEARRSRAESIRLHAEDQPRGSPIPHVIMSSVKTEQNVRNPSPDMLREEDGVRFVAPPPIRPPHLGRWWADLMLRKGKVGRRRAAWRANRYVDSIEVSGSPPVAPASDTGKERCCASDTSTTFSTCVGTCALALSGRRNYFSVHFDDARE